MTEDYLDGYHNAVRVSAALLNIGRPELSLALGEMSLQEWRTVCSALALMQRRIKSLDNLDWMKTE